MGFSTSNAFGLIAGGRFGGGKAKKAKGASLGSTRKSINRGKGGSTKKRPLPFTKL